MNELPSDEAASHSVTRQGGPTAGPWKQGSEGDRKLSYLHIYLFVYFWLCGTFLAVRLFLWLRARGALLFNEVRGPVIAVASCVAEPWL